MPSPYENQTHAITKGQEYCFWLMRLNEPVGSLCVWGGQYVSETVEMGSSLTVLFGSFVGGWDRVPGGVFLQEVVDLRPSQPD